MTAVSESSIGLDFYYRGVRCRERLKLPPTPRNKAYARNLLGQIKVEIAKGTFDYAKHFPDSKRAALFETAPGSLSTMREGLEAWYREKERELEHSSLLTYGRIIDNILVPKLGDVLIRDFSRLVLKDFLNSLPEDLSTKRLVNLLTPLRGVAAEAVRDEVLASNPFAGYVLKRRRKVVDKEDVDPFSPEEMKAIVEAAEEPQFENYCRFNFATGLRTSEMIGLRWTDVDLKAGTVTIRRAHVMGKTKSTKTTAGHRVVSLIPAALKALKSQQEHTRLAGGAVFHNPRTDEAWDGDRQIREHYWRLTLVKAEVRYRYPYQMRHTFASQALSAGENVMWVAKQLGHKDWTITAKKYARWIPSVAPEAGNKVAALWD